MLRHTTRESTRNDSSQNRFTPMFAVGDIAIVQSSHWDESIHGQAATIVSTGVSAEGKTTHYVRVTSLTGVRRGQYVHADELARQS